MAINTPQFMAAMLTITAVLVLIGVAVTARRGAGWRIASVVVVVLSALMLFSSYLVRTNVIAGWVETLDDLAAVLDGAKDDRGPGPVVVLPQEGIAAGRATMSDPDPSGISDEDRLTRALPADTEPGSRNGDADALRELEKTGPQMWEAEVVGADSGLTKSVTMWVPEHLDPRTAKDFGVVVFMHGQPGGDDGTIESLDMDAHLGPLAADGTLGDFIVVIPDLGNGGREPNCVDIEGSQKVETLVAKDLVRAVRTTFPGAPSERGKWTLAGVSAGAYCAPVTSLRHADTFWGGISLGGYDNPLLGWLTEASPDVQEQFTISHMLTEPDRAPANLLIVTGASDDDAVELADNAVANASEASPKDNVVVDKDTPGGHIWSIWANKLPASIFWWQAETGQIAPSSIEKGEEKVTVAPPPDTALHRFISQEEGTWSMQGMGTIAVFSAAGLGMLALTMGVSPRLRARGWAWLPVRLVAVAAATVVLFATVFLIQNHWTDGFISWLELWQNRNSLI